jgi:hypothetical protein
VVWPVLFFAMIGRLLKKMPPQERHLTFLDLSIDYPIIEERRLINTPTY